MLAASNSFLVSAYKMAVILKVNAIDKTADIDWQSLEKVEVLTREPDTLRFLLRNYGTKTFRPALGDEVTLFEDATKIFGGVVIESVDTIQGNLKYFSVNCKDFTHTLDRKLVAKTYTGFTANAIIADIVSLFVEAGFTTTNVNAPTTVQKIVFNYLTVSQALQKLAETIGGFDWYVDYDKDIHFFQPSTISAPFNLTDTSQNFVWNSLDIQVKTDQLRNHIIIRGGDVEGATVDNNQVSDGSQRAFFVGYSLNNFVAQKSLAATPTTFFSLTVGRDGVDDPNSFDALYNPNDGLLIFRDNNKPATNDHIKTSGLPIFPLIAEKIDVVSVGQHGTFQYLIVDKSIRSREAASQKADAELIRYAQPITEGSFVTYNSGLRTGQTININSVIRNTNKDFKIDRIVTRLHTPTRLRYEVSIIAVGESVTMVDILNKLLIKAISDQIEIGLNEVVDRLFSAFETITINESFAASTTHNAQTETVNNVETPIVQPLNYATIFVYGHYIPVISFNGADTKRVFILDGSPLG